MVPPLMVTLLQAARVTFVTAIPVDGADGTANEPAAPAEPHFHVYEAAALAFSRPM